MNKTDSDQKTKFNKVDALKIVVLGGVVSLVVGFVIIFAIIYNNNKQNQTYIKIQNNINEIFANELNVSDGTFSGYEYADNGIVVGASFDEGETVNHIIVDNYKDLENDDVRVKYGSMAGVVGIVSNILLGLVKVILGVITLSISIITDAINNITDSISSIVTIIGYKLSNRKADEDHPFGHQRIEFISGLIVAVLMLAIAVLLLKESITKIINPEELTINPVVIIIMGISILVKLWQCLFYRSVGKAIKSISLKATSRDSLNDSISTFCVLIGLIIYYFTKFIYIDGIIGVLLSIYVIYSSIGLIIEASGPLIGEIPEKEKIEEYKKEIKSYDGILGVHDMVCHMYGPTKLFMTAHAEVSSKVDVLISHDIIDNIEKDFRDKYNIDLTIHLDPIEDSDEFTNDLRFKVREKIKEIDNRFDIHDFRVVRGETHTNLIFDIEITYDSAYSKDALRVKVNEIIKEINPNYFGVIQIDQMYDRK